MSESGGEKYHSQKELEQRKQITKMWKERKPVEVPIEKGEHAGKTLRIVVRQETHTAFYFRGIVDEKVIAMMYTNLPMGGAAVVSNAEVALSYWRSGVATKIYSEII